MSDLLAGWRASSADTSPTGEPPLMFVTPPETRQGEAVADNKRKRSPGVARSVAGIAAQESSALPDLKKGRGSTMKRTPQANMAQSRLTSAGGTLSIQGAGASSADTPAAALAKNQAPAPALMELGEDGVPHPIGNSKAQEPLTADFFRNLMGENTRQITERIDKIAQDLSSLTKIVESNTGAIGSHTAELQRQAGIIEQQKVVLDGLGSRMEALERGDRRVTGGAAAATVSKCQSFLTGRRSVRMWPIDQSSSRSMWKGVGEFMHSALDIDEDDIGPDDIEEVVALPDPKFPNGNLRSKVLVRFADARKRDMVVTSAAKLASRIDSTGKPTAGMRLEIPENLMDVFRLLSRFGTRLRAKHGEGTRRHVKVDDMEASLYMNIKLPGDESWSKVTPEMARTDLEANTRAESAKILRRIAAKDSPVGPRQRLALETPSTTLRVADSKADRIAGTRADKNADSTLLGRAGGPMRRSWTPPNRS